MLARAFVGFAAVVGFVALGAWVQRQRRTGRPIVRALAGRVHHVVGVVAVAVLALLAWTAFSQLR